MLIRDTIPPFFSMHSRVARCCIVHARNQLRNDLIIAEDCEGGIERAGDPALDLVPSEAPPNAVKDGL
jgi:hypothetical protein